ncbi:MAG TPA: HAD family phosphatase [Polyangiaceae bacterium]|nr:HAD family phosphatase [Polyangiaceae bacterium]
MFPATLFDYNGVLVDDEAVHLEAFRDVLGPLGLELSERAYVDRYLGFDDAGAFDAILRDAGRTPSEAEVRSLIEAKRPRYLARAEGTLRGFPGARELVRRRAAAGPVVIVSGALRDEIELGLSVLGVRDAVQKIVSAEDARRSKPDPEGYLIGLVALAERIGPEKASRALVVEDSLAGVEAAKAARLACVAVAHSYPAADLSLAGADLVVETLDAITDAALSALYEKLTPA